MATKPLPQNDDDEQDYYYQAPHHTRPFSAGLKCKRVTFIPATSTSLESTLQSSTTNTNTNTSTSGPTSTAAAKYLSIVLRDQPSTNTQAPSSANPHPDAISTATTATAAICPICSHPLPDLADRTRHETTIAHQLCLEHSHPPSNLDRQRKGLKYLEGYGWDPDSRLGLGARSEGIRIPVKAKEKRDTTGLGLFSKDDDDDHDHRVKKKVVVKKEEKRVIGTLNAKQVRKLEDEKKKKAERLRKAFYGEDLSRYLGPGA